MAAKTTDDLVPYSLKEHMSRYLRLIDEHLAERSNEVAQHFGAVRKLADSLRNGHPDDPNDYIRHMEEFKDANILLSKWLDQHGYDELELHPEYKTVDQLEVLVLHEFYERYFEVSRRISKGSWGHIFEVKKKMCRSNSDLEKLSEDIANIQLLNKMKDNLGRSNSAVQIMVEENAANLQDLNEAKKEVIALAALSHPNVVQYRYAWIQLAKVSHEQTASAFSRGSSVKAIFHIQMDVCWKNLPAWLADRNQSLKECQKPDDQTIEDGLKIFRQVMEGVKYVHANGIAHHDIQPHSILFGFDLVPKIGDFRFPSLRFPRPSQCSQVAKLLDPGERVSAAASTRDSILNAMKEDIYGMGRILLELICPFPNVKKLRGELEAIASGRMPVMKAYPENVRNLIFEMLNEDPNKRPTAQEVLDCALF